jgi:AcrR family transcriptional regulator
MQKRSLHTHRRLPTQERARHTVDVILEAVLRILRQDGADAVTTNRVAQVAGVSIGSVYQYFPDKRAIYAALHERHIAEVDRVIGRTLVEYAKADLKTVAGALYDAIVDTHLRDQAGWALLMSEVPHRSQNTPQFAERISGILQLVVSSRIRKLSSSQLEETVFILAHLFDALSHAAALWRPAQVSIETAKKQGMRAIVAYIETLPQ